MEPYQSCGREQQRDDKQHDIFATGNCLEVANESRETQDDPHHSAQHEAYCTPPDKARSGHALLPPCPKLPCRPMMAHSATWHSRGALIHPPSEKGCYPKFALLWLIRPSL